MFHAHNALAKSYMFMGELLKQREEEYGGELPKFYFRIMPLNERMKKEVAKEDHPGRYHVVRDTNLVTAVFDVRIRSFMIAYMSGNDRWNATANGRNQRLSASQVDYEVLHYIWQRSMQWPPCCVLVGDDQPDVLPVDFHKWPAGFHSEQDFLGAKSREEVPSDKVRKVS